MPTFTPPTLLMVPPIGARDELPLAARLWRFHSSRARGVAVFKMTDGSYVIQYAGTDVSGPLTYEPWPALPQATTTDGTPFQQNNAINVEWNPYDPSQYPITEVQNPGVAIVYYGGHVYPVSSAEAAALTAAGFGAYIS